MDIKLIAQVACSILALLSTHGTCQGDCEFLFHQQPVSDLSCNPHHRTTTLHLTCFASGPIESHLQISWWSSKLPTKRSSSSPQPLPAAPLRLTSGADSTVTETRADNSQRTLISSTLSLRVPQERGAVGALCVWCEIEAPGRALVSPASTRLCVQEDEGVYVDLRACELQEIVPHSFNRVCIEERQSVVVVPGSTIYHPVLLEATTQSVWDSRASHREDQGKTAMPAGSMLIHVPDTESALPSNTPAPIYPLTDMPTAHIGYIGNDMRSSMTLPMGQGPFATPGLTKLFPTPTRIGDMGEERGQHPGSPLLSGESLTALYAAVGVCVLLAAVVVVLIAIVFVICRRHRQLRRRNNSSSGKSSCSRPRLGPHKSPRAGHYRSQLSFSGSEMAEMKRELGGGGEGVPIIGAQDTRYGSEQGARKGSLDTRSSIGSRSVSTEKSNSLPRKNSLQHKYAEIETISHVVEMSQSAPHHNGGFLHQQQISSGKNGGVVSSKVIPPPPNTRARCSSTPHFYYILEKMDRGEEGGGEKEESRIKSPWEVGAPSQIKSRSREGSGKNRAGSLKREVGEEVASSSVGKQGELCWGDGTLRSRSGSCPGRERKGGSTKRVVVSREGSSKSTKSHSGSGKRATSVERNGKVVTMGSREGSVKSRGSREGSGKKQVWVPAPDPLQSNNKTTSETRVPPPYDALDPKFSLYPSPFSIINENYLAGCDDGQNELFDDPKYAAVSVGDLPQLVDQHRHQSLDPIVPRRNHRAGPSGGRVQLGGHRGGGGGVGRVKAASSKSLQDSGALTGEGGGGGGGVRESIYETRDSTLVRGIGMSVGGHTPSRLSMPFDSYYS